MGAIIFSSIAHAQDYPNRVVKMLHGFPPGGNVDAIARVMANEMANGLKQPVVVESKPGMVGSFAAEAVARAAPDGYTLLTLPSAHAVTGALYKNLKYRPIEDFAWISTVSFYPFVISVRAESRFRTLADLLAAARAEPGRVTYGSSGAAAIQHMTPELLGNMTGVKFQHIPYRGESLAITGLLSGDVDFIVSTMTVAAPQIESGKIRALGVTSRTRWRDLPGVPTIEEAGVPGFEVVSWTGIATVAGVPAPILSQLHAEVQRAIAVPEVKKRLADFGGEARGTTPDEMRALVVQQLELWEKVAKEANISVQ
jgi:tripartite-type tricarboxylate transporter receptor subunit TctC